MNRSVRSSTTSVLSILVALLLPGLLAFNLVRAAGTPGSHLDSGLLPAPMLVAQAQTGAVPATAGPVGMVTGVLYTRGKADIAWNGARFSVDGGSYAYVGGETVRMAPDSMGLLKLPGGGSIFLCSGSQVRLVQAPGGGYNLDVMSGSSRVQMPVGTDFSIQVNDTVVRPAAAVPETSMVEAEVQARSDGGCLICELKSGVSVTAGGESQGAGAQPGRVMEVAGPGVAGEARISAQPIPPALIQAAAPSGDGGPVYLCQCEDLKEDLDSRPEEDSRLAEASETETDSETAASETPGAPESGTAEVAQTSTEPTSIPGSDAGTTPVVADGPPPVAPPDAPPAAVADATAPDPFDPNVLPPPAAGEPADPVVVVAPPGVPSFGSGGGGGTGGGGGGGGGGPVASPS